MTIDKGLKKAIKSQPTYRLPSNFTYRMMQQVREEAYARERREEFRLRLALVIFCVCALGGLFYYIIKVYRGARLDIPRLPKHARWHDQPPCPTPW